MWPGVQIVASGGVSDCMDQLVSTAVTAVGSVSDGSGSTRSTWRNTSIGKRRCLNEYRNQRSGGVVSAQRLIH
jgi:hypothetical protein